MGRKWKTGETGTYPVDLGYEHIVELSLYQAVDLFQRFIPEVKIVHDMNVNDCVDKKVNLDNLFLNKMFVVILPGNIAVYKHDNKWVLIQLGKVIKGGV